MNNRKKKKGALFKVGAKGLERHTRHLPEVRFRYTSLETLDPATSTQLTIHAVSVSCQEACQHHRAEQWQCGPKKGTRVSFITATCALQTALPGGPAPSLVFQTLTAPAGRRTLEMGHHGFRFFKRSVSRLGTETCGGAKEALASGVFIIRPREMVPAVRPGHTHSAFPASVSPTVKQGGGEAARR